MVTLGEHRELRNLPGADQSVSLFVACGLFGVPSSSREGCELDVLRVDEESTQTGPRVPSWDWLCGESSAVWRSCGLLLKASGPVLPCGMSPSALKHLP